MAGRCRETPAGRRTGDRVTTALDRIGGKARSEPGFRFTSLYHLMDRELLRGCFEQLRANAAAGIDGLTKAEYAQGLEQRLTGLVGRLQRMAYRPQPVKRRYIPKPGTDQRRPLGIPALEDKLVQAGLVRILERIYESDFIGDSYGFRPARSAHDALRALSRTVESRRVHWIVEADIKGFFDHVNHEWMLKFLAHRIGDPRVLRLVRRFLKAGVVEGRAWHASEEGTPQGGVISPLLANVYLHYALDLWFERVFRRTCRGHARLIRYADDFVVCFECEADARAFREELADRLGRFGLELHPSKTQVLAFGPTAAGRAKRQGRSHPETFDFLGFTHYCSRTLDGRRFRMKRVTSRKRFRAKLAAFKDWLKAAWATLRNRALWLKACEKLRGHYAYYGVTDNSAGIQRFAYLARRLLFKWLNRQGGKRRMTWETFARMEAQFPLPRPRVRVNLF